MKIFGGLGFEAYLPRTPDGIQDQPICDALKRGLLHGRSPSTQGLYHRRLQGLGTRGGCCEKRSEITYGSTRTG